MLQDHQKFEDLLRDQTRAVRRRQYAQAFGDSLVVYLTIGVALAAVLVAVDRVVHLGLGAAWIAAAIGGGLASLLAWRAAGRAFGGESSMSRAARAIDARYEFKERVASANEVLGADLHSSFDELLVEDAGQQLGAVHARDVVPARAPRASMWLGLALLGLLAVWLFMPEIDAFERKRQDRYEKNNREEEKRIAKNLRVLGQELAQDENAQRIKLALKLEKELEQLADELDRGRLPRQQGALELARMADQVSEEVKKAEAARSRSNELKRMKEEARDEASASAAMNELRDALKEGDLGKASESLSKLAEELARELSGATEEEKEAKKTLAAKELSDLAKQLADKDPDLARDLEKALEDLAKDGEEGMDELARKLSEAAKKMAEASELMEAIDKLQDAELEISQELADLIQEDACKVCGKFASEHGPEDACAGQPGGIAGKVGEGEGEGEGEGKGEGEGEGEGTPRFGPGRLSSAQGESRPRPAILEKPLTGQGGGNGEGDGTGGEGRGRGGEPPEAGPSGKFVDEQAHAIGFNRGSIIARKLKRGLPDDPGNAEVDYSDTMADVLGEMEEAMEEENIPLEHRDRIKTYYDYLRGESAPKSGGK